MTTNVRQAVYGAEFTLRHMLDNSLDFPTVEMFGSTVTLPAERKFASIDSIQNYLDKVLSLNWVRASFDRAKLPVKVRERKGQRFAHYQMGEIAIPPFDRSSRKAWAMRELVVIHELAHHLDTGHGHDSSFTGTFVRLVSELMSPETGWLLQTLFYSEGVKVDTVEAKV